MIVAEARTLVIDFLVEGAQDINICYFILAMKLNLRYFARIPQGANHRRVMTLPPKFIREVVALLADNLEPANMTSGEHA